MNKKTLSVIVALTMTIATSGNVLAAPANTSTSLDQIKSQRQDLEAKVENLDEEISKVMQQISDNKKSIEKKAKDIKAAQIQLDNSEKNIKGEQDLFGERIRAMYINGIDSYLDVLLQASDLSDFISRVDNISRIVGFDEKVIGDLKDKKDVILKNKQLLEDENNKLLSLKADNEKKLSKLNSDKNDETKLIASLNEKEKQLERTDTQAMKLVASAESQVQSVRNAAPRLSRGSSSSSMSSNAVVAYASNFLGTPYQWGGNGPSTFDCSGFTSYVFAHFGVSLPRTAEDQQQVGTPVSSDQLQPGDLVFFGYPAHHVGIYVGNGCYINAPHTGDVVKIAPISRSDYSGARRVQ